MRKTKESRVLRKIFLSLAALTLPACPFARPETAPDGAPTKKDYPWADVPFPSNGVAQCDSNEVRHAEVCDWARSVDALVAFGVDSIELVEAPTLINGIEVSPDQCETTAAGAWLSGRVIRSAPGVAFDRLFKPGGLAPSIEAIGRRLFFQVIVKDGVAFTNGGPLRVEDGIVVELPSECNSTREWQGWTPDAIIERMSECGEFGTGISDETRSRRVVGAICYPPVGVEECSFDFDCIGPGATCVDGACVQP